MHRKRTSLTYLDLIEEQVNVGKDRECTWFARHLLVVCSSSRKGEDKESMGKAQVFLAVHYAWMGSLVDVFHLAEVSH